MGWERASRTGSLFAGTRPCPRVAVAGIAFLDFDNTVIHGDIGPLYGNYLIDDRYDKVLRERGRRAAWRDQLKVYARYTPYLISLGLQVGLYKARALRRSSLVRTAYKSLKGIPADDYYQHMQDFVDLEIPNRIYPEVRDAMQAHLDAGRQVVIITTGVEELLRRCLPHLPQGVEIIGCRLREKYGKLTGKVDGPLYGADKANIVQAYCKAAGVNPADCWAYTDHYSDFHMLDAVGHGACINPRKRLEAMAHEKGWQILRPVAPMQETS